MKKSVVSKAFSPVQYKDLDLNIKVIHILERMTDNVHFPEPLPSLKVLEAANNDFSQAIINSRSGGKLETAIKRTKRKELETILKQLSEYVQITGGGDAAMNLSSGFNVHKKAVPVGILDKPLYFKLKMGSNQGAVELSSEPIRHALYYVFEYCEAPLTADSIWIRETSSRRKIEIIGLRRGKEYCFRMAGARTHPARVWSNVISSYVI